MFFKKKETDPGKYRLTLEEIPVEVSLKNIRHMYLRVCPGTSAVKISAPLGAGKAQISAFALRKIEWIKKHRSKKQKNSRAPLKYITGETHYFEGREFSLQTAEHDGPPEVRLCGRGCLELTVKKGSGREKRKHVLDEWYRERLKERIPPLIEKWEKITGIKINEWRIRKMKTRWGTCSVNERRIWFNLELAKKPERCLEYIVVHEIAHLAEPRHNERYKTVMDSLLPDWRKRKKELDNFPG